MKEFYSKNLIKIMVIVATSIVALKLFYFKTESQTCIDTQINEGLYLYKNQGVSGLIEKILVCRDSSVNCLALELTALNIDNYFCETSACPENSYFSLREIRNHYQSVSDDDFNQCNQKTIQATSLLF